MQRVLSIVRKLISISIVCSAVACSKSSNGPSTTVDTTQPPTVTFDINSINDTYADLAPFTNYLKWGSYNVHDPSIKKFGDYYYCYSTDVGYGITVRSGIQIRKSKDLVQWQYVGWVFNSLPAAGAAYITQKGGTPFDALWAPYIIKVGAEYRLYYSLSSSTARLSVIGLATAVNPEGPWTEKGIVVTSANDNTIQTNAIDPTVVITPVGDHYMYYGSAWDGIYIVKLDPSTGLAAVQGDKGKRIANRGFTNGKYNGNIEGAEIIYYPDQKKYYLFISYDWLQTKYNVRVCRSDNPDGPFYDFNSTDANTNVDHGPMIIAPYQFNGHSGWQGTAHCTVFDDGSGQYFIAHQGRPGIDSYFMDLHVRKLFWNADGWPVASPERYAWEDNAIVPKDSLVGNWEQIILGYKVVPGYAAEQVSPDFQTSVRLTLAADGTLNGDANSKWTYNAPWLQLNWSNGYTDKVYVQKGRDWENRKNSFILTGLNNAGTAIWAKKVQ
ncbi:MAG: arabinan endo-1,5-alpha-L-arabinosidase [Bacteroidota bacterium]|nr:arabinan endo-1,5-alpha-L-arabinosidase [Bacteroidota bacterium]